ncbi:amidohydrolase family domain protein [Mycobacterium kansasii 662]|uniref:Amidohydrolase family domain protein n=1 Tax=Mycobacterium kansasii 662 TaxID=1299326 RepID=X7XQ37_MYCKA|nr:amidohydrolase family domain protein [Mycobacterium kansasii 662]
MRSSAATIRVNPDDIAGAVREIEKVRSHPRVVQIGVPLQSREGLWQAAILAAVGGAARREPAGGGSHRIRRRHRISAHAVRHHPHLTSNTSASLALNYLYHLMK